MDDRGFELSWPKNGEKLFTNDGGMNNACLNWQSSNFEAMCSGYLRGAELLMEHVLRGRRDQDLLVYPIIYQYRHYLELRLKQLSKLCGSLLGKKVEVPWHHSLLKLWMLARPLIQAAAPQDPKKDLDAVEETIRELDRIDPNGEAFRYSETKGHSHLASVRHIDLANLGKVISGLTSFFEGATTMFEEHLGWKSEMLAEERTFMAEMENELRD